MVSTDGIAPGPFLPRGCSTMLIVPVATAERVYGVAILGEERTSRAGAFAPPTVAQSVAEARQIALVVDALRQLEGPSATSGARCSTSVSTSFRGS